jgi:ketosteroid isomerase-like protein
MRRLLLVSSLCLAVGSASAQGESTPTPEAEAEPEPEASAEASPSPAPGALSPAHAAVEAGNYFFAKHFEARDARAISELYTEDAQVIAPGAEPAVGRAAIEKFWAGAMEGTVRVRLETRSVESDGAFAFEDGVVHLVASDGSETAERYVVVWKRVGRRWHLHRDIWNGGPVGAAGFSAEPAPTPEPTEPAPEPMDAPLEPSPTPEEPL